MNLTLDDLQLLIDYAHGEFAHTPHGVSPFVVLDAALSRLKAVKEDGKRSSKRRHCARKSCGLSLLDHEDTYCDNCR